MNYEAPMTLNYKAELKNELFGLDINRAEELVKAWTDICWNAVENIKEYKIMGAGENKGQWRLDEGRLLSHFVENVNNNSEWAFCIYSASKLFESILEFNDHRQNPLASMFAAAIGGR